VNTVQTLKTEYQYWIPSPSCEAWAACVDCESQATESQAADNQADTVETKYQFVFRRVGSARHSVIAWLVSSIGLGFECLHGVHICGSAFTADIWPTKLVFCIKYWNQGFTVSAQLSSDFSQQLGLGIQYCYLVFSVCTVLARCSHLQLGFHS